MARGHEEKDMLNLLEHLVTSKVFEMQEEIQPEISDPPAPQNPKPDAEPELDREGNGDLQDPDNMPDEKKRTDVPREVDDSEVKNESKEETVEESKVTCPECGPLDDDAPAEFIAKGECPNCGANLKESKAVTEANVGDKYNVDGEDMEVVDISMEDDKPGIILKDDHGKNKLMSLSDFKAKGFKKVQADESKVEEARMNEAGHDVDLWRAAGYTFTLDASGGFDVIKLKDPNSFYDGDILISYDAEGEDVPPTQEKLALIFKDLFSSYGETDPAADAKESKLKEARMSVDYVKSITTALKTAKAALKDKDYEAAKVALEDVADDAQDAAKATTKIAREESAKEDKAKEKSNESVVDEEKFTTVDVQRMFKNIDPKAAKLLANNPSKADIIKQGLSKGFEVAEGVELKESYGNSYIAADIKKGLSDEEIIAKIQDRYPDIGDAQAKRIIQGVKSGKGGGWKAEEGCVVEGKNKLDWDMAVEWTLDYLEEKGVKLPSEGSNSTLDFVMTYIAERFENVFGTSLYNEGKVPDSTDDAETATKKLKEDEAGDEAAMELQEVAEEMEALLDKAYDIVKNSGNVGATNRAEAYWYQNIASLLFTEAGRYETSMASTIAELQGEEEFDESVKESGEFEKAFKLNIPGMRNTLWVTSSDNEFSIADDEGNILAEGNFDEDAKFSNITITDETRLVMALYHAIAEQGQSVQESKAKVEPYYMCSECGNVFDKQVEVCECSSKLIECVAVSEDLNPGDHDTVMLILQKLLDDRIIPSLKSSGSKLSKSDLDKIVYDFTDTLYDEAKKYGVLEETSEEMNEDESNKLRTFKTWDTTSGTMQVTGLVTSETEDEVVLMVGDHELHLILAKGPLTTHKGWVEVKPDESVSEEMNEEEEYISLGRGMSEQDAKDLVAKNPDSKMVPDEEGDTFQVLKKKDA